MTIVDWLKQAAGAFLCPQACVICNRRAVNPQLSPLCSFCLAAIPPFRGPICCRCGVSVPGNLIASFSLCSHCREGGPRFSEARSWGLYEGELRRVIQAFKFDGHSRLAEPLSDLLRQCLAEHFIDSEGIIPVPLHARRAKERGFDQTLLLASSLSAKTGIPVHRSVRRNRNTVPQFGLSFERRRLNIKGAFEVAGGQALDGKRLLIVDDVMTTGATVEEMCRILQTEAAPEAVNVLTVARVSRMVQKR